MHVWKVSDNNIKLHKSLKASKFAKMLKYTTKFVIICTSIGFIQSYFLSYKDISLNKHILKKYLSIV